MRFELTVVFTTPPFQDGALNRSANSPKVTSIILLIFKEMSTINCIISYFFVYSKLLFARFIISIALIRKKIPSGSNLIHKGVSSIVSLSDA